MKYAVFDDFFTVLGNKQRVKILQYLNSSTDSTIGGNTVGDISHRLNIEQSAVSHNLRRLLECHFVEVEKRGKERIYSINTDTIRPLFELIDKHVCKYCREGCKHWE